MIPAYLKVVECISPFNNATVDKLPKLLNANPPTINKSKEIPRYN